MLSGEYLSGWNYYEWRLKTHKAKRFFDGFNSEKWSVNLQDKTQKLLGH